MTTEIWKSFEVTAADRFYESIVAWATIDIVHKLKRQIILFYAHMNTANRVGKICKLECNWPVRVLESGQTSARDAEGRNGSQRTRSYWIRFRGLSLLVSSDHFRNFTFFLKGQVLWAVKKREEALPSIQICLYVPKPKILFNDIF